MSHAHRSTVRFNILRSALAVAVMVTVTLFAQGCVCKPCRGGFCPSPSGEGAAATTLRLVQPLTISTSSVSATKATASAPSGT